MAKGADAAMRAISCFVQLGRLVVPLPGRVARFGTWLGGLASLRHGPEYFERVAWVCGMVSSVLNLAWVSCLFEAVLQEFERGQGIEPFGALFFF